MFFQPMCSDQNPTTRAFNRKAVALFSGGLDSALAVHLVKRQGVDVTAVHFTSFFSPLDLSDENSPVLSVIQQLDVPLVLLPKGEDFLDLIRKPRFGHGKNLNPCIDCRIYTFVKAKAFMEEIGASFLVTGEVVGQRPMSQRRDAIRLIEKQAGCDGIVVRPLSARSLPPTLPEQAGVIDREQLLDVTGRGRKVQLRLAAELGLTGYSSPAGGCLLTDKIFSRKLRDLLDGAEKVSEAELMMLHVGRHIRLRPGLKIVVSRNEAENHRLEDFEAAGTVYAPVGFPGPMVLAVGTPDPEEDRIIGSILLRYSKESARGDIIEIRHPDSGTRRISVSEPAENDWIADRMI